MKQKYRAGSAANTSSSRVQRTPASPRAARTSDPPPAAIARRHQQARRSRGAHAGNRRAPWSRRPAREPRRRTFLAVGIQQPVARRGERRDRRETPSCRAAVRDSSSISSAETVGIPVGQIANQHGPVRHRARPRESSVADLHVVRGDSMIHRLAARNAQRLQRQAPSAADARAPLRAKSSRSRRPSGRFPVRRGPAGEGRRERSAAADLPTPRSAAGRKA